MQVKTRLLGQIAGPDHQIDRLNHNLYGMTEEQIVIVEGKRQRNERKVIGIDHTGYFYAADPGEIAGANEVRGPSRLDHCHRKLPDPLKSLEEPMFLRITHAINGNG
jgi:hypothetical protein